MKKPYRAVPAYQTSSIIELDASATRNVTLFVAHFGGRPSWGVSRHAPDHLPLAIYAQQEFPWTAAGEKAARKAFAAEVSQ